MTKKVLNVPLHRYDVTAQDYVDSKLYITSPKSELGTWYKLMLEAQNSGRRLPTSAEWFLAREYLHASKWEEEADFVRDAAEWTGTVLDYDNGQLLEGITLNPDGSIKTAKRLGKKDGILLPTEGGYVKNLGDEYMLLVSQLWGVKDPKKELRAHTYLWITPGFRPVARGGLALHPPADASVNVDADNDILTSTFASRFVSDIKPGHLITPQEYSALVKEVDRREAVLRSKMEKHLQPFKNEIDAAVVLVE